MVVLVEPMNDAGGREVRELTPALAEALPADVLDAVEDALADGLGSASLDRRERDRFLSALGLDAWDQTELIVLEHRGRLVGLGAQEHV